MIDTSMSDTLFVNEKEYEIIGFLGVSAKLKM